MYHLEQCFKKININYNNFILFIIITVINSNALFVIYGFRNGSCEMSTRKELPAIYYFKFVYFNCIFNEIKHVLFKIYILHISESLEVFPYVMYRAALMEPMRKRNDGHINYELYYLKFNFTRSQPLSTDRCFLITVSHKIGSSSVKLLNA